MARQKQVVISPDLEGGEGGIFLIPMKEWKQSGVRALRATAAAFAVLGGGGTAAQAFTQSGLPPLLAYGLPSTGVTILDTAIICLIIFLVWFIYNCAEFYFDVDEDHPKFRA